MHISKIAQKRKRFILMFQQKLGIVNQLEKGESVKKLYAEFGIGEQNGS